MFEILKVRHNQGFRTVRFPAEAPSLPDHFRGQPKLEASLCPSDCSSCSEACPTGAIDLTNGLTLDKGRCLFCTACMDSCPTGAISFTKEHRLAAVHREDLKINKGILKVGMHLSQKIRELYGRSLALRVVSAGGCGACEAEVNVLNTIIFDLSRFGIHYVASPRHADALIVIGTVTLNMKEALKATFEAIPSPKFVIAVGACAISGGPFIGLPDVLSGAEAVVPVDLFIPGCPPSPYTILDGILRVLGKAGS